MRKDVVIDNERCERGRGMAEDEEGYDRGRGRGG